MNAIDRIHEFDKFGSVLGLERMNILLKKLGNPEKDLRVIHVAGTNGKGSICRYMYEVLQTAGYKTGLFTSPFLEVFNERIEFDGEYISDSDLEVFSAEVLSKADEMVKEGEESPTEFEVVTAISFLYFKEKHADYVILEVGLGGRGDSTNVIKQPLATVIASISLDHTDRLGETIAQIAFEKAGIIKKGCPVISAADKPEAKEVIMKRAEELGCDFYDTSETEYILHDESFDGSMFTPAIEGIIDPITLSMPGIHQIQNAIAALTCLMVMKKEGKISIRTNDIKTGFRRAKQIGRFEVMRRNPLVVIDGAHNEDGSRVLADSVKRYFDGKKILMVTGIMADKDVDGVISNFLTITKDFVAAEPANPRRIDAEELAGKIEAKGGNCRVIRSTTEACRYAQSVYGEYDMILFAGSLYFIGEIRGLL